VKALITSKINTDISSRDFYEKIKSNKDFLKKVFVYLYRKVGLAEYANLQMLCFVS